MPRPTKRQWQDDDSSSGELWDPYCRSHTSNLPKRRKQAKRRVKKNSPVKCEHDGSDSDVIDMGMIVPPRRPLSPLDQDASVSYAPPPRRSLSPLDQDATVSYAPVQVYDSTPRRGRSLIRTPRYRLPSSSSSSSSSSDSRTAELLRLKKDIESKLKESQRRDRELELGRHVTVRKHRKRPRSPSSESEQDVFSETAFQSGPSRSRRRPRPEPEQVTPMPSEGEGEGEEFGGYVSGSDDEVGAEFGGYVSGSDDEGRDGEEGGAGEEGGEGGAGSAGSDVVHGSPPPGDGPGPLLFSTFQDWGMGTRPTERPLPDSSAMDLLNDLNDGHVQPSEDGIGDMM